MKPVLMYQLRESEKSKEPTEREMTATYLANVSFNIGSTHKLIWGQMLQMFVSVYYDMSK